MYTRFLSLVHQSPFHCRAGQSSPGRLCRGSCTLGTNSRGYFGSYTLHFVHVFSILHTEQLESSREIAHWRKAPRCVGIREGRRQGGNGIFFLQWVWHRYYVRCYCHGFWLGFILASQGNPADPKIRSPAKVGSLHNQWKEIDASQGWAVSYRNWETFLSLQWQREKPKIILYVADIFCYISGV